MLLASNQALLWMDDTKVFMSWMANGEAEIQSLLRQLAIASSEPEIGCPGASVCRKVSQEGLLSSSQKRFPLFAVSRITDAAPAPGDGQSYVDSPTSLAEVEKSAPGLLLVHKDPAGHHDAPAPPYMHTRCCASTEMTKICRSRGQRWYLTPATAAGVSSSFQGKEESRKLTLRMKMAQQPLFGQNVIS